MIRWILWGLCFCGIPQLADSAPADLQRELARFSNAAESEGLSVSALFLPLEGELSGAVQYQADLPVVPASVTKLVTSYVALAELGPDFTFSTRIYRQGTLDNRGVISGSLIVEGTGDPFLVSERMWLLANQLRQSGIRRIDGDLIVDPSGFPWSDPSVDQAAGETDRAYAALPSVLAVNFNTLAIRITPGARAGDPVQISSDPLDTPYLELDNQLKTGAAGTAPKWFFDMEATAAGRALEHELEQARLRWISGDEPVERARLRGRIAAGTEPFVAYRRVRFPLAHFGALFRAFLRDAGIELTGSVILDSDAGARTLLTEFESPPLQDLLASMNRYSNNFIANQLAIAVHRRMLENGDPLATQEERTNGTNLPTYPGAPVLMARPAGLAEAGAFLARWMKLHSDASADITLEDGSGLSSSNRLNADALVKLLVRGWNDFSMLPKLMYSLPGPRGVGTLRGRFAGNTPPPDLWAKTGTFQDARVCSLAGYFDSPQGPVAFAILLDGTIDSRWNVDRMQTLQELWIDLYLK